MLVCVHLDKKSLFTKIQFQYRQRVGGVKINMWLAINPPENPFFELDNRLIIV